MNTARSNIRRIETVTDAQIESLTDVPMDCVRGGASVGFMAPLERKSQADGT
jgi:hypothetical protein